MGASVYEWNTRALSLMEEVPIADLKSDIEQCNLPSLYKYTTPPFTNAFESIVLD